jgi:RNA polymerase sigma factor (sigma-70 family)
LSGRRKGDAPDAPAARPIIPNDADGDEDRRAETQAALESLPARYRKILVLHDVEGLSMGEIARRLGVSRAAAERRWMRAIVLVAERLKRVEGGG